MSKLIKLTDDEYDTLMNNLYDHSENMIIGIIEKNTTLIGSPTDHDINRARYAVGLLKLLVEKQGTI